MQTLFQALAEFAQKKAAHLQNWQGHIWDVLFKSVSFYEGKY